VTRLSLLLVIILSVTLSACSIGVPIGTRTDTSSADAIKIPPVATRSKLGNPTSYVVFGKRYYVMDNAHGFVQRGLASWYGKKFHGRKTSSGEIYNMHAMTAAHKTLPLPSYVRVVNIENGRSIVVKVNDRGPFIGDRIIDLSFAGATKLGVIEPGTAEVEISVLSSSESKSRPVVRTIALVEKTAENVPLFVQLGSFGNQLNAQNLVRGLHDSEEPTAKVYKLTNAKGVFYRVRLGPLYDIDEANLVVLRLKKKGFETSRVVVHE
jgi:rare lipoprotein A|tara:strand:+ start:859 stop:1656 length:798 start_codon:yes stop_codon:yes gene_type:complete